MSRAGFGGLLRNRLNTINGMASRMHSAAIGQRSFGKKRHCFLEASCHAIKITTTANAGAIQMKRVPKPRYSRKLWSQTNATTLIWDWLRTSVLIRIVPSS